MTAAGTAEGQAVTGSVQVAVTAGTGDQELFVGTGAHLVGFNERQLEDRPRGPKPRQHARQVPDRAPRPRPGQLAPGVRGAVQLGPRKERAVPRPHDDGVRHLEGSRGGPRDPDRRPDPREQQDLQPTPDRNLRPVRARNPARAGDRLGPERAPDRAGARPVPHVRLPHQHRLRQPEPGADPGRGRFLPRRRHLSSAAKDTTCFRSSSSRSTRRSSRSRQRWWTMGTPSFAPPQPAPSSSPTPP